MKTYNVVDKDGEIIVENAVSLEDVKEELETMFYYDIIDEDSYNDWHNSTLNEILENAELTLQEVEV